MGCHGDSGRLVLESRAQGKEESTFVVVEGVDRAIRHDSNSLGYDVFILSMPLKGINLGPGCTDDKLETNHWWFLPWEEKGDSPLRSVAALTNHARARARTLPNRRGACDVQPC